MTHAEIDKIYCAQARLGISKTTRGTVPLKGICMCPRYMQTASKWVLCLIKTPISSFTSPASSAANRKMRNDMLIKWLTGSMQRVDWLGDAFIIFFKW